MTPLDALLLGVVEGVTEFLPISSTGHLILASSLLHIADSEFLKTFEIAIQLGAILAVVALYWRSLLNIEILKRVIIGFIPTGVIGLALYKVVKTYLLGSEVVVLWALALGGLALIGNDTWRTLCRHQTRCYRTVLIPPRSADDGLRNRTRPHKKHRFIFLRSGTSPLYWFRHVILCCTCRDQIPSLVRQKSFFRFLWCVSDTCLQTGDPLGWLSELVNQREWIALSIQELGAVLST